MRRFGLIGYPLSHSFSKKYFSEKFLREGIVDCEYENFPIPAITDFRKILSVNRGIEGLNVTIPYKQSVIQYLDHYIHTLPIAACNCIKIRDGISTGYNTDIIAFEKSLLTELKPRHQNALILGNGGSAQAVQYVLRKLGIFFKIVSRQIHDGAELVYEDLDEEVIRQYPLIINTTPLGMYPHIGDFPRIPYQHIGSNHYLYDLVYNPGKTLFLQKGEEMGATIRNGADMLIIQAEASWKIWNS
jgi:shikimate dehydrogenase